MSGTRRQDGPDKKPATKSTAKKTGSASSKAPAKRSIAKQVFAIGQPNDWRSWLQRLLVVLIAFVLVCVGVFFVAYEATTIPDPNAAFQAQTTNVFYADGSQLGQFATQKRESVPLSSVSQTMQDAVVAAEDRTFWTNKGIDIKSILRSVSNNAGGGATQGGSTITMQYVKILYLNQSQTITRKIKQIFLALKIQKQESKAQILEGYLNTIYFGHGAYGVQVAAQTYFGVPASNLTTTQAAMLAAVVNQPSYLDPSGSDSQKSALLSRYQYVLDGMVKMGTLDSGAEAAIYDKLPPVVPPTNSNQLKGQNGFMLSMVKQQLLALGFTETQIYGSGLQVTTTLQPSAMQAVADGVQKNEPNAVKKGQDASQLHVGAASVDVKTGALLGFYGGQDFLCTDPCSHLNWSTTAQPPGSVFKVLALAMALTGQDAGGGGWSLKNTFNGNSPLPLPGVPGGIQNEGEAAGMANGRSYGRNVTLMEGLRESINTVFVDMTMNTSDGPNKIKNMATAMGVPANAPGLTYKGSNGQQIPPATISLGSASVSPVDIANTYATVANGGMAHPWYVVSKVTDSTGKVLWTHQDKQTQAMTQQVAADVTSAMQQVTGSGTGVKAKALGRPVAGKTGTATDGNNNVISSWFAGFTPQVATAVMYVRGDGTQTLQGYMNSYYGADFPTMTWADIMRALLQGQPTLQFPAPGNVTSTNNAPGHQVYTPPPSPTFTPTATQPVLPTDTPTPTPTPSDTSSSPSHKPTKVCTPVLGTPYPC